MKRQRELAAVLAAVLALGTAGAAPAHGQTTVTNIGGRLELFVDRYLIQTLDNTTMKLHKPVDKGIVFHSDMPWEGNRSAAYNIINDGDRFRCYYKGAHFEKIENLNTPELPWRTCVRISSDGITWEAPSLGLTNFNGSTDNSLLPVVSELTPDNIYVNANPNAPAQDRFLAMVNIEITSNGVKHLQWYVSASPDGLHFTMKPGLIKDVPNCDGGHVVFWDSNLGQYVAYTRIWYNPTTGERGGWDVRNRGGLRWVERSVSADLTTWSAPVLLKFKDALGADAPAEHIYTFEPSFYFRAPHLQIMLVPRDVVGRSLLGWEIGPREPCVAEGMLMSSRDGLNWDRTFMEAVFRPGLDLGNWVWKTMWPVGGFIQTSPTEISGYTYEHAGWGTRVMGNTRVRRWAWRLDGFTSVNAGSTAGEMITKPFVFSGRRLVLNHATGAAGSIRVEIQNTNGVPVTGYALADCAEKQGDEIGGVMSWNGGSDVSALTGTPVRLRFVLKDADLYSMRFAN
jgi:hypothetical protein